MTQLHLVGQTVVDADEQPTFETWWLLQLRKVKRDLAKKEWDKLSEDERFAAMIGWVAWRPYYARREWEWIPHPRTWLYNKQWTDELPAELVSSHASHQAFAGPEPGERSKMPDHVKALIAKLKK